MPVIGDDGLVLGLGTVLARLAMTRSGEVGLTVEADAARILALLSVAYRHPVVPDVMKHVARAADQWRRGEKALAHIELAFARLPRLTSEDDAFRLFLAADLLADGVTPDVLMGEEGFDIALSKYDPEQPRRTWLTAKHEVGQNERGTLQTRRADRYSLRRDQRLCLCCRNAPSTHSD